VVSQSEAVEESVFAVKSEIISNKIKSSQNLPECIALQQPLVELMLWPTHASVGVIFIISHTHLTHVDGRHGSRRRKPNHITEIVAQAAEISGVSTACRKQESAWRQTNDRRARKTQGTVNVSVDFSMRALNKHEQKQYHQRQRERATRNKEKSRDTISH
jgi:hypothetical protein